MHVVCRDTVAVVVVPHCKHTAEDVGVAFFKLYTADVGRSPVAVEVVAVEVVVVVASCRHDIYEAVGDRYELVALFLHILGLSIGVVPNIHDDVFALHWSLSLGVCQRTPYHSLFAEAFYKLDVVVGEFAEFFYHLLVTIAIFVGTNIHALATEYRILAFEVFAEYAIDEGVGLGVEHVEVVHAVFLATELRLVVYESQAVCWYVDFGDHFNIVVFAQDLQVDKFLLGIVAILGSQTRVLCALETESRRGLVPIAAKELTETIVVEVHLERIHFIVSHSLYQIVQIVDRHKLARYVNHKTAQFVHGYVHGFALRQCGVLFGELEQCTCCPERTLSSCCSHGDVIADVEAVALFAQLLVILLQYKKHIAGLWCAFLHCKRLAKHGLVVSSVGICHAGQLFVIATDAQYAREFYTTLCTYPCLQFGNDERLWIDFC